MASLYIFLDTHASPVYFRSIGLLYEGKMLGLGACLADQSSSEKAENKNGIFTYALKEILSAESKNKKKNDLLAVFMSIRKKAADLTGGKAVPAIFYKESDRGVNKPAEIRR